MSARSSPCELERRSADSDVDEVVDEFRVLQGVGAPIHGKTVYAGAMNDASGVATVLETARVLSQGDRPKRSVLFLVFTAEEKGLLGSRYFAGHPTVPYDSIIADLNLDMFMPIFALKKLHVQGLEQSSLGDDARAVGAAHHIGIAGDPEPDRNSLCVPISTALCRRVCRRWR